MAKRNPSTIPRPSSMRFLRNLSAISRAPAPSSALLTILASLVGSVNPLPVACQDSNDPPPSFLCPSLQPRQEADVREFVFPPQTPPPPPPVPGPSKVVPTDIPTPPAKHHVRRSLAPGYTQGEDGRWRKLSTWSLYGSTVCVCHDASSTALNLPVDDLATTPAPSSTSETDFLPPGWSRPSESSTVRTALILSLSLVLAAVITVFIIVFLLWRRKRRHQLRKDVEKKLVKRKDGPQGVDSEKEYRVKTKLWARATTRWRENVRQSARRRRNTRLSTTLPHASNDSVVSLANNISSTASSPRSTSPPLPESRASSPTPTISTVRSIHSSSSRIDHEPQDINIEPPSPSSLSSPHLPPAYQGSSDLSPGISSSKDPSLLSRASSFYHPHLAQIDSLPSDSPSPSPFESDTISSNLHVAHVATDDKAVLRQMEVLSSQPPIEPGSSEFCSSAPVLYEDDVQSFEYEDAPELGPSPVGFPPLPATLSSSKGKAAALEYYDYDDLNVEPDPQPSAPPFEAENPTLPSAPPQDEAQPHPSAPLEIVDPGDDPTALGNDNLSLQIGGQSVDDAMPGPPRSEPLPQYRP